MIFITIGRYEANPLQPVISFRRLHIARGPGREGVVGSLRGLKPHTGPTIARIGVFTAIGNAPFYKAGEFIEFLRVIEITTVFKDGHAFSAIGAQQ
jgi:hypothetical protein